MSSKAKSIIILLLLCVLIAVIPLTMSKIKVLNLAVQTAKQKLPSQKSTQIMKHGLPRFWSHREVRQKVFCSVFRPGLVQESLDICSVC